MRFIDGAATSKAPLFAIPVVPGRAVFCELQPRVALEALELIVSCSSDQVRDQLGYRSIKKPDVACDTGFRLIPQEIGQASQAERMRGLRIRRFIGESPVAFLSAYET